MIDVKNHPKKMNELWDLPNRHQLNSVIYEILRLLHNFLASAKSLLSQTRVAVPSWYERTDFLKEYYEQVTSRFTNNPITKFIEDLRNYNLHYSLPITHATFSIHFEKETEKNNMSYSFVLVKSGLLEWSRWSKEGKNFLRNSGDQIDIGNLVDEYYKQILDFHSWLINRLLEVHKEDLAWLAEMRKKTINAMSEEERKFRGLA